MRLLLFTVLGGLAACSGRAPRGAPEGAGPPPDGAMAVEWRKGPGGPRDTVVGMTLAATGRWCAADTVLEILSVRNDTAVGLSLLPADSLRPAPYPVYPASLDAAWRPRAGVALRYFTEQVVVGYQSGSGAVTVTEGNRATVSGTIDAHLRTLDGKDSIRLTGRFTRIAVRPATGPCGRAVRPGAR